MLMKAARDEYCFSNICSVPWNPSDPSAVTRSDISVMIISILATLRHEPANRTAHACSTAVRAPANPHLLQLCTCNGLQAFITEIVLQVGCVAVPVQMSL